MRTATALSSVLAPVLAPVVALLLLAAPAAAFSPDRAALMVDAVRANGCAMTADEAAAQLAPLGLDPVEVQAFVDTLYGAGLVTISDDNDRLMLSQDLCDAAAADSLALIEAAFDAQTFDLERWEPRFAPETGAAMLGALRAADCTLTDAIAAEVLPPLGIDPSTSRDIVAVLIETGQAGVDDAGVTLTLFDPLCSADPSGDLTAIAAALDAWHAQAAADQNAGEVGE